MGHQDWEVKVGGLGNLGMQGQRRAGGAVDAQAVGHGGVRNGRQVVMGRNTR